MEVVPLTREPPQWALVTRRKSGQKPQDLAGNKNGLLCSQVLVFSGKSGTLLQQDEIGMRKVSGFALFAIKSHRVCSFSKNGTEGAKQQKAGLIPEYPRSPPAPIFRGSRLLKCNPTRP